MDELQTRLESMATDIKTLIDRYDLLNAQYAMVVAHLAARQIAGRDNDVVRDERNITLKKLALAGELLIAHSVSEGGSVMEIVTSDLRPLKHYPTGE